MNSNEDNPYYSMIGMMRKAGKESNGSPFFIGTVKATAPLTVQVGDIPITRKNMKINRHLLKGYTRQMRLDTTEGTGTTAAESYSTSDEEAFRSHSHGQQTIGIPNGTFTTLDDFSVGDEVLLLVSADDQQYVLICKLA